MISLALSFSDSLVSFPQTTPIFTQKTHGLLTLALVGFRRLHVRYVVVVYLDSSFFGAQREARTDMYLSTFYSVLSSVVLSTSYHTLRDYAFLSFKQVSPLVLRGSLISFSLLVFVLLQTQSVLRLILLVSQYYSQEAIIIVLGTFLFSCIPKFKLILFLSCSIFSLIFQLVNLLFVNFNKYNISFVLLRVFGKVFIPEQLQE